MFINDTPLLKRVFFSYTCDHSYETTRHPFKTHKFSSSDIDTLHTLEVLQGQNAFHGVLVARAQMLSGSALLRFMGQMTGPTGPVTSNTAQEVNAGTATLQPADLTSCCCENLFRSPFSGRKLVLPSNSNISQSCSPFGALLVITVQGTLL